MCVQVSSIYCCNIECIFDRMRWELWLVRGDSGLNVDVSIWISTTMPTDKMYTNLRYWIIFHNAYQLCSGPTAEASNGHPVIHKLRELFNHRTQTWTAQTRFYSQSHGINLVTFLHEYVGQPPAAAASLKYHRTFSKHTCCLVFALNSSLWQ